MLSRNDLAKYPFLIEAAEYVGNMEFSLEDFSTPDYERILDRAVSRIKNSVLGSLKRILISSGVGDVDVEVLSFPIAIIMMKNIGDPYFQKRFALFESKKASESLTNEKLEKILRIAQKNFGWNISEPDPKFLGMLKIHFANYLKNASRLHEDRWKLVNRLLEHGDVYITKPEAVRLLEEEIRAHIESKFEDGLKVMPPETILKRVDELKVFFQENRKNLPVEEALGKVDVNLFPPCMRSMYTDVLSGRNVSHLGRFTLTAFLINIGMDSQDVAKLYTSATDFDERITKYQVNHIAGLLGGKTRYKPLNCTNMQTHRLCINSDNLCLKIKNPLTYYKIKTRKPRQQS